MFHCYQGFIIFGVRMNILFVFKAKILVFRMWSYRVGSPIMLTIESGKVSIFWTRGRTSFEHMFLRCQLYIPYLTTLHSTVVVHIVVVFNFATLENPNLRVYDVLWLGCRASCRLIYFVCGEKKCLHKACVSYNCGLNVSLVKDIAALFSFMCPLVINLAHVLFLIEHYET